MFDATAMLALLDARPFGPFRFHGKFTDPTIADLDAMLQQRDARFGVRDVREEQGAGSARDVDTP